MCGRNAACAFECSATGMFSPYWTHWTEQQPMGITYYPLSAFNDPEALKEIVKQAVREVFDERESENCELENIMKRFAKAWKALAEE